MITEVWVPGHPKTKGSMTTAGRRGGQMRESVDNTPWRALVTRMVAADLLARGTVDGLFLGRTTFAPVRVDLAFWLDHPDPCEPKPGAGDVDKLVRLVLDALKDATVYVDDNQVILGPVPKFSSKGVPGNAGVLIKAREVTEAEMRELEIEAENDRERLRR